MSTFTKDATGIVGWIERYIVQTQGDLVTVLRDDGQVRLMTEQYVDGLGAFVARAKSLCVGQGTLPDGDAVIYLFDWADDAFGYAVNLQDETCSEWGYAPFRVSDRAA